MGMAEIGLRIFLQDTSSSGFGAFQSNLQGLLQMATNGQGVFYGLSQSINSANGASGAAASSVLATRDAMLAEAGITVGAGMAFMGFAGAISYSVQQSATLDDALAGLQIAFNATDGQMGMVKTTLLDVANNSRFTTSEVADGWTMLAEKGQSLADVVQGKVGEAMVILAEATKSQTVPAAELLSTTMTIFNAKASEATNYVNLLTFAFYHGIPSISQMQTVIQDVGAKAAQMHIPFQDLITVMDFLTRSGIQASVAANSLRFMLDALTAPTKKTQDELSTLGLITINTTNPALLALEQRLGASGKAGKAADKAFDGTLFQLNALFTAAQKLGLVHTDETFYQWADANGILNNKLYTANGQFIGLTQGIDAIGQAIAKLPTDKAREDAINTLFAPRSAKDATLLLDNLSHLKQELDKLGISYTQFLASGGGPADAARLNDTFNGSLDRLRTTIGSFMANVGGPFADMLKIWMNGLNNLVGSVQKSNPQVFQMVSTFLIAGAGMSGLVVIIGGITLALTAFGGILGPIVGFAALAVVAITALSGIATVLAGNWNTVVPIIKNIATGLLAIGATAAAMWGVGAAIQGLLSLGGIAVTVVPALAQIAVGFAQSAASMAASAAKGIIYAVTNLSTVIPAIWAQVTALWASAVAWVAATGGLVLLIPLAIAAAAGIYMLFQKFDGLHKMVALFQGLWASLLPMFASIGNQIKGAFLSAIKELEPSWKQLTQAFETAKPVLMIIGGALLAVAAIILGVVIGVFNGLLHMVVPLVVGIIGLVSGIIKVFMGVVTFFLGFFTLLRGMFTGNETMMKQGLGQMANGILMIFSGLWNAVKAVFVGAFSAIWGFVTGFVGGIIGFFTHLSTVLVGHSIIPDMWKLIVSVFQAAIATVHVLIQMMVNVAINIFTMLTTAGPQKIQQMVAGIGSAIASAGRSVGGWITTNIVDPITNTLSNFMMQGFQFGQNFMHMLANGIQAGIQWVMQQATNAANGVKSILGFHSPPASGPLADSHKYMPNMMSMFATGISSNNGMLQSAVGSAASALKAGFTTPSLAAIQGNNGSYTGGSGINGASTTVNFCVDSKVVAQATIDRITGVLTMNGINRTMR